MTFCQTSYKLYNTKQYDNGMWALDDGIITFSNEKALRETQTLRAGCSKAEPTIFAPPQTPSRERGTAKIILISWRWSPLADPELQFRGPHGERGARAYNGGPGAEPPAGCRGRAPGQGSGGEAPLKLKAFWPWDVQRTQQICTLGPLQFFFSLKQVIVT